MLETKSAAVFCIPVLIIHSDDDKRPLVSRLCLKVQDFGGYHPAASRPQAYISKCLPTSYV